MAGPLALRDYGVLGVTRPRWWTTVPCVWLGALSHLLTDHVTHASLAGTGLGIPALGAEVVAGVPWFIVVHLVASALGATVLLVSMYVVPHAPSVSTAATAAAVASRRVTS